MNWFPFVLCHSASGVSWPTPRTPGALHLWEMTFSSAAKGGNDDLLCNDLWLGKWMPNSLLKHLFSSGVTHFYLRAGFRHINWMHYQKCHLHSFSLFPFSLPFWPRLIQSSHGFPLEWLGNVSQYFPNCFPAKAAAMRHYKHQHKVHTGNQQLWLPVSYRRVSHKTGGGG